MSFFKQLLNNSNDILLGLVAQFKLNGNTNDTSGSGNNGTIGGSPNYINGQNGSSNGALNFNNNSGGSGSDRVDCPSVSSVLGTNGSISLWINPTGWANTTGFYNTILSKNGEWILRGSIDNTMPAYCLAFDYWDGTNVVYKYITLPTLSVWTHIVVIVQSGVILGIYSNGVLASGSQTTWFSASPTPGTDMAIGNDSSGNNAGFNGAVDDVRVYNRVLSSTEITTLYNNGAK